MSGFDFDDDDRLLEELRALVDDFDAPPAGLEATMRHAFNLADPPDDLAELVFDSALERLPAGVRGDTGTRLLTFEGSSMSVEVEVNDHPRSMVGQFVPPPDGSVSIRLADDTIPLDVDELGRFHVENLPRGPFSIRCRTPQHTVDTDWFLV